MTRPPLPYPISPPVSVDWAENNDLAAAHPDILAAGAANFTAWHASVVRSIEDESESSQKRPLWQHLRGEGTAP